MIVPVMDPYEWLPGYGESCVRLEAISREALSVRLVYDSPEDRSVSLSRALTFDNPLDFRLCRFPGPIGLGRPVPAVPENGVPYEERAWHPGMLGIVDPSEAAASWSRTLGRSDGVKEYTLQLVGEDLLLSVVAESFSLGPEGPAPDGVA